MEEEECTTRFPNPTYRINPTITHHLSQRNRSLSQREARKKGENARKGRERTANSHSSSLSLNNASIRSFFAVFFSEPGAVRIFNLLTICLPQPNERAKESERIDKGGE